MNAEKKAVENNDYFPSLKNPDIFDDATSQQNPDLSLLMYLSNSGTST